MTIALTDWSSGHCGYSEKDLLTTLVAAHIARIRQFHRLADEMAQAYKRGEISGSSKRGRKPWRQELRDPVIHSLLRLCVAAGIDATSTTEGKSACCLLADAIAIPGLTERALERIWNRRPERTETRRSGPRRYGGQCADCGRQVSESRAAECRGITVRCVPCEAAFFP